MLSRITQILIALLTKRDDLGRKKYGVTLDRRDLTHAQWLDHATEELLDAAGYLQAAKREHLQMLPNGWRIQWCKSNMARPGDRWEIYGPHGGGVVCEQHVECPTVRAFLDAIVSRQELNK